MIEFPTLCTSCVHWLPHHEFDATPVCKAFPDRIPNLIWREGGDHTYPIQGDHDIQYEMAPNRDDDLMQWLSFWFTFDDVQGDTEAGITGILPEDLLAEPG